MALFRFQRRYAGLACLSLLISLILTGCQSVAPPPVPPEQLYQHEWQPEGEPAAVIVAMHGFNDHTRTFALFAETAINRNVAVIAYDHPGFGRNPDAGYWPGSTRLIEAAQRKVVETRERFPDTPLYLLGASMGGAVGILASTQRDLPIDGLILSAPAVWGGQTLNPIYRLASRLMSALFPDVRVSPKGLRIHPSDNVPMLRDLAKDPYFIQRSRSETVDGLVSLMDEALAAGPKLSGDVLLLAGAKDEVVPAAATDSFLERMENRDCAFIRYPDGWHMLLRDLQRDAVFSDILTWINAPEQVIDSSSAC